MNTVAGHWATYNAAVLPKDAPEIQRTECRLAFYAGAQAALMLMANVPESEAAGIAYLQGLHDECRQFAKDYAAGKGLPPELAEAVDRAIYAKPMARPDSVS